METIINRNTSYLTQLPKIKDHRKYVWESLRDNPSGLTAQQISDLSHKRVSLNSVRSRLNELLNDCLITIKGSRRNPITGKVNTIFRFISQRIEIRMLIEKKLVGLKTEKDLLEENYFKYDLIDERLDSINKEINRLEEKKELL